MKPDVLERLDTYCAHYGIGRGRAIGHLLKGALPDPSWLPPSVSLVPVTPRRIQDSPVEDSPVGESQVVDAERQIPKDTVDAIEVTKNASAADPMDDDLRALQGQERPEARFVTGDRVTNNSGKRRGRIDTEPRRWVPPARMPSGQLRPGHWSYAVAWDGQMGLTIRYAEDLLRPLKSKAAIASQQAG